MKNRLSRPLLSDLFREEIPSQRLMMRLRRRTYEGKSDRFVISTLLDDFRTLDWDKLFKFQRLHLLELGDY